MSQTDKQLVVRNLAQAVLFEAEIKGQLSDGYWENYSPWEHWRSWSNVKVVVGLPSETGRNFYPLTDRYNLHALLDVVGERMQFMGALAKIFPIEVTALMAMEHPSIPESEDEIEKYERWAHEPGNSGWAKTTLDKWRNAGLTADKLEIAEYSKDRVYPMKQLRKDLTELKKSMKTKV